MVPITVPYQGRWAHFNVKLHFFSFLSQLSTPLIYYYTNLFKRQRLEAFKKSRRNIGKKIWQISTIHMIPQGELMCQFQAAHPRQVALLQHIYWNGGFLKFEVSSHVKSLLFNDRCLLITCQVTKLSPECHYSF